MNKFKKLVSVSCLALFCGLVAAILPTSFVVIVHVMLCYIQYLPEFWQFPVYTGIVVFALVTIFAFTLYWSRTP